MIAFPNAKINIGLTIVAKRADGYHNIETVFYPISLCDVLEIVESKKETQLFLSGNAIEGSHQENLCLKAYHLLKSQFDIPNVEIYLHKQIPTGAGLGGGSSNAAFTLKILRDLFQLPLNKEQLKAFARQLGADCAFFIENTPVFAQEKGDKFEKLNISLKGYSILLVKPKVSVSTAEAYKGVNIVGSIIELRQQIKLPISTWKNNIHNYFEDTVFNLYPEIATIKNQLYDLGAIYASMSGSGSAVYGIFEKQINQPTIFTDCFVWQGAL